MSASARPASDMAAVIGEVRAVRADMVILHG
jgi:hypothetical protein